MTEYNGHKDHKHWNVALWINNDEKLYREAVEARKRLKTKKGRLMKLQSFSSRDFKSFIEPRSRKLQMA